MHSKKTEECVYCGEEVDAYVGEICDACFDTAVEFER